jgi:DNA polymerase-3 subunit gamma/tau
MQPSVAPEGDPAPAGLGTDRPAIGALRRRRTSAGRTPTTGGDAPAGATDPPAPEPGATKTTEPGDGRTAPGDDGGRGSDPADAAVTSDTASPKTAFPTRDELVQAWGDQLISGLRPKAKALFQAGRFVHVEEGRAVYGLPNETHRTRCEDMRAEVEAALAGHFGRPIPLALVVEPGADAPSDRVTSRQGSSAPSASPRDGSPGRRPSASAAPAPTPDDDDDDVAFDESELGEVADVGNLAEARVLQAFPGAEEVS